MKNLFDLIPILNLYPLWAQLSIFACAIILASILIFTPRKMPPPNEPKISIEHVSGDVVVSQNQSGGITAHTVTINTRAEKRNIKKSIGVIVNELKKHPIAAYRLEYSSSDPEATDLANDIDKILEEAKWQRINPIQRLAGPSLPKGVTIFMLKEAEPMVTLSNQLWIALGNKGVEGQILQDVDNVFKIHGWPPVELPNGRNGVVIFIGPNQED